MTIDINDWTEGMVVRLQGDVTQLQAIAMATPEGVARQLGYAPSRMVRGYWICVLQFDDTQDKFVRRFARDFIYAGTTLRSGGRMGLPAETAAEDRRREHVSDVLLRNYGQAGYDNVRHSDLYRITPKGHSRLIKVMPFVRHDPHMPPNVQYPQGGAHLQWTLTNPKPFVCAAKIDGSGMVSIGRDRFSIGPDAPEANHFRLLRHLERV